MNDRSEGPPAEPGQAAPRRFAELDSLRGLAALAVFGYHVAIWNPVIPKDTRGIDGHGLLNLIKYTPLRVFYSGPEAVFLFFVLSGFVLSLAFYRDPGVRYLPFLAKRTCRLWIPYAVSIAAGTLLAASLARGMPEGLVQGSFEGPVTMKTVAQHLAFITEFDVQAINPPVWSLVYEMRISILFPVIVMSVLKLQWHVNLLLWGIVAFLALRDADLSFPYTWTGNYIVMFVVGALLARHHVELVAWMTARRSATRAALLLLAVLAFTARWWLLLDSPHVEVVAPWGVLVGSSLLIILSLASRRGSRVLLFPPIAYLGQVSYSFYLFHALVLFACIRALEGRAPYLVACLVALPLALLVASIVYRFVEVPSIRLGRHIERRMKPRAELVHVAAAGRAQK